MRKHYRMLFFGFLVAVFFFGISFSVTVEAETSGYDLQAEDKLDQLDVYVNVTAEIVSTKADSRHINFESRVSLVTSKTLAPLVVADALRQKTLVQPGLVDLPYLYQVRGKALHEIDYDRLLVTSSSATKTANDTGEFSGYNSAYKDTFSVQDDLDATTTLPMNASDWVNAGTLETDYQDYAEALKANASETDFMATSTYQDDQEWRVQVSGFSNLETEFTTTIEANIAANNSVDVDDVHITWYNLTSANLTSYLTENLVSAIRGATTTSASYLVSYSFLGLTLFKVPASAMPFIVQPAMAAAISLKNTVGRVLNFGKLFVSKTLPAYATQIKKNVAGTITKVQNNIKPIVHAGLSTLSQVSKQIQTLGSNIQQGFSNAVTKLQTFVGSSITNVYGLVRDKLTSTYNLVSKGFGGILGSIPKAILSTIGSFLPFLIAGLVVLAILAIVAFWWVSRDSW